MKLQIWRSLKSFRRRILTTIIVIRKLFFPFYDFWYPAPSLFTILKRYVSFLKDRKSYYQMPGAEKFSLRHIFPLIHDKYSSGGDFGQYFYQDIWAFKRIFKNQPQKHVDVGSLASYAGMLSTITDVTYIDVRPCSCDLSNFETKEGDITNLPYTDDSVASLSCLHVAEHIGLGRYGDKLDPKGTEKAIKELIRVLAPNGNLFFSMPVFKNEGVQFNSCRMYSISKVLKMFSSLDLIELSGIDERNHFIENIDPKVFDKIETEWGGVCLLWYKKIKESSIL